MVEAELIRSLSMPAAVEGDPAAPIGWFHRVTAVLRLSRACAAVTVELACMSRLRTVAAGRTVLVKKSSCRDRGHRIKPSAIGTIVSTVTSPR